MKSYLLKEGLEGLWKQGKTQQAAEYLAEWVKQLRWQRLKPFDKLAQMLLNHLKACWTGMNSRCGLDVVEAINGNIRTLLQRGRGYRNLRYLLLKAQRMAVTKTEFVAFRLAR